MSSTTGRFADVAEPGRGDLRVQKFSIGRLILKVNFRRPIQVPRQFETCPARLLAKSRPDGFGSEFQTFGFTRGFGIVTCRSGTVPCGRNAGARFALLRRLAPLPIGQFLTGAAPPNPTDLPAHAILPPPKSAAQSATASACVSCPNSPRTRKPTAPSPHALTGQSLVLNSRRIEHPASWLTQS
jgi:hypothetical protein